jgi:maltose/moltooligosaccharide transporter
METSAIPAEPIGEPFLTGDVLAELEQPVEGPFPYKRAINYSVANLGASLFYGLFNFGMPLYLSSYGLPAWLIGLLANERSFVGALVQPMVGRLSDRIRTPLGRRRPFFLVGIPLVCLGMLALAYHPEIGIMIAIMAVLAFFLAVAWDPYMAMMADLFPEKQRGRVGGILGLGVGLGNIAFAIIALTLWSDHEFSVFIIIIVVMISTWAYTFFTVKEPPATFLREKPSDKVGSPNPIEYVRSLRRYPEAAKYTLAITFFWLGTGGVIPFITPFAVSVLGVSESESFILVLAATGVNALLAVPLGLLADRFSKKRVMTVGMICFGVIAIVGSQSQTLLQGAIVMGLAGGANAAMAMINPMLIDLVPKKRTAEFVGLGSAVFSFAAPVGSVVAGLVAGLAALWVGGPESYRWTFITAGVMLITGGMLLRNVHPERVVDED